MLSCSMCKSVEEAPVEVVPSEPVSSKPEGQDGKPAAQEPEESAEKAGEPQDQEEEAGAKQAEPETKPEPEAQQEPAKEAEDPSPEKEEEKAEDTKPDPAAKGKKLDAFLSSKGYGSDVNGKRKSMWKHYYPLHDAVVMGDAELVQELLTAKADPSLKSSSGKTPLERAKKLNVDGSRDGICKVLAAAADMPAQAN